MGQLTYPTAWAVVTLPKIIMAMAPKSAMPARFNFKPGIRPIANPAYVMAKMIRMLVVRFIRTARILLNDRRRFVHCEVV